MPSYDFEATITWYDEKAKTTFSTTHEGNIETNFTETNDVIKDIDSRFDFKKQVITKKHKDIIRKNLHISYKEV